MRAGIRDALTVAGSIVLALTAVVVGASPAGARQFYPVVYSSLPAVEATLANPGAPPPGANDWSCRPTPAHPRPVVLVHGTAFNMTFNWNTLSPLLKNRGYCVFALNYGGLIAGQIGATGPIEDGAVELARFVDAVLGATGSEQVDMVGFSQGGMLPRYYMRFLGGADKVNTLIGLAPNNHGTTFAFGASQLPAFFPLAPEFLNFACKGCQQQIIGSDFMRRLNAGGDTEPGVRYVVIISAYDQVITPYTSAFLDGPDVTNILLQKGCDADLSDHPAISFDRVALRHVLNGLDPAHAEPAVCTPTLPGLGG